VYNGLCCLVLQNPSPVNNPGGQPGGSSYGPVDPFLSGVAGTMLRQQGQSYLQRSQAYMQSKIGFLSGSSIQYLFDVTPSYGACESERTMVAGFLLVAVLSFALALACSISLTVYSCCFHTFCPYGTYICFCYDVVGQKLLMLMFPFLKKWTYSRIPDQVGWNVLYWSPGLYNAMQCIICRCNRVCMVTKETKIKS